MTAERYDPIGTVLRIGLAASLTALVLQSVIGFIVPIEFRSYDSILDLERNNGIPDILSTVAILAAAIGALLLAEFGTRARVQGATLFGLLLVVAVDDVVQEEAKAGTEWGRLVIATVFTAAVLLVAVALRAPRRAAVSLLLGLVLLGVAVKGAYTYDQILNVLGRGDQERGDFDYELGIVLKQALELMGWSLVAIGLWATALAARARSAAFRSAPGRVVAPEPAGDPR